MHIFMAFGTHRVCTFYYQKYETSCEFVEPHRESMIPIRKAAKQKKKTAGNGEINELKTCELSTKRGTR